MQETADKDNIAVYMLLAGHPGAAPRGSRWVWSAPLDHGNEENQVM
jgi:hypothetical protein